MIPIRLQGPQSSNGTGRVEVFYRGEWGTICDNYWWDLRAANVACRQLGYQYAVRTIPGYVPSSQSSRKIRLNAIRCTGKEQNLTSCSHTAWGYRSCNHNGDAGVECSATGDVTVINVIVLLSLYISPAEDR